MSVPPADSTADPSAGSSAATPEQLLADHVEWVRRLARQLVRDAHAADDLTQDVCLAALEDRPEPRGPHGLRAWLATVLRNRVHEGRRGAGRRRERESASARPEATEGVDQIVERVALERELVEAVLALDPPYRDTVLLRFFEGLAAREIAARMDTTVNTVNSRLARALAQLRQRLDRTHGARGAWALAWLPLVEAPTTIPTLGGLLLNAKLILAACLLVGATTATWFLWQGSSTDASDAAREQRALASPSGPASELSDEQAGRGGRAQLAAGTPVEPSTAHDERSAPAPTGLRRIRGRVLDHEARPVQDVELELTGDTAQRTQSANGGWFEFETATARGALRCVDERWITIREGAFGPGSANTPYVLVAPWIELSGFVHERGQGVGGAHLSLQLPGGFEARFGEKLEATHELGFVGWSKPDGKFQLGRVPKIPGSFVRALADGYLPALVEAPPFSVDDFELLLERPVASSVGLVRGRVIDVDGAPVAEARVALGLASTLSDERGHFELDLASAVTADGLCAVKVGHLPARLDRPREPSAEERARGETGFPDPAVLQLGGPPLSIRGVVLDHEKKPRAGLRLWIEDPTPFGRIGRAPLTIEGLLSGDKVPPQLLASGPRPGATDGDDFWDWTIDDPPTTALWSYVRSDEQGRFELRGLGDRKYRIALMDDATLQRHVSEPIRGGEHQVEIVLPAPAVWPRLAGIVESDEGVPLPGVSVTLSTIPYGMRARVFGGRSQWDMIQERETVTSDERGRFVFRDVPKTQARWSFRSEAIVPRDYELPSEPDPDGQRVRVFTRCSVQVDLQPPRDRADSFSFQDEHGKRLDVLVITAGSINAYTDADLTDGMSEVVSVSSAARFLVLQRRREEVQKMAIRLSMEGVNRLTP